MKKILIILFACLLTESTWANHWTPQSSAYSEVMALTSVIQIDGIEQFSDQLEVGVFCDDECRGSQMAIEFEITHRFLVQLTIYGENGHELTFKLFDHSIGEELSLASPDAIIFNTNGIGQPISPLNPYILDFTSITTQNTSSGLWSNPNIWNNNNVPGAYASVVIANDCVIDMDVLLASLTIIDGKVLRVLAGNTLTVIGNLINNDIGGLVIEDGAQVINKSPNVKATVEKDVIAYTAKDTDGWYLISSSVDEMPIAESDFITETYDLYRYKENGISSVWENYRTGHADFNTFENGRGYLYANSNSFEPSFTGDLNYSDVVRPITCNGSDALSGFNVIGNPFPHTIYKGAGGAIDDANLAIGYYTLSFKGEWEARTYDDAILPGQGIMVKTTTSKNITIAKTTDAATAESTAKNAVSRLKFSVLGDKGEDRAYAYFGEGIGLDKIDHLSDVSPMIYIANNDGDYAIAMMDDETERFDLDFKARTPGWYTLSVNVEGDFHYLHLIDKLTGEEVDLLIENSYTFIASQSDYENRFIVVVKDYTGVDEVIENATFAYVSNENVVVSGEGTMQLVDINGRIVKIMDISGVTTVDKPSSGLYIIRIINGTNVKTQKIVVK